MSRSIYIGDRAFLHRYGSALKLHQIKGLYKFSLNNGLGICCGDLRTATLASSIKNSEFIYHSRFLLRSFHASNNYEISESYLQSKINFLYGNEDYIYSINHEQIYNDIHILENYTPSIVTIGGDWLDILISIKKWDLISSILSLFKSDICKVKLILTFKPTTELKEHIEDFDGIILPLNILNMDDSYTKTIRDLKENKLLFALHVLAGGILPLNESLDYLFNHVEVDGAIIGTGKKQHIEEILSACASLGI